MSDYPAPDDASAVATRPRTWLQFGLRGMLLLTALVAVWGTHLLNLRSIEQLEARVAVMRHMAAELTVDDPSRIAVVKRPPLWYDEQKWDLYLPAGGYRLCLATEAVDEKGFAPIDQEVMLPQGRMQLELTQNRSGSGWRVTVLQDDREVMAVNKPSEWDAGVGSSGGGLYDRQQEFTVDEQVILMRRRFMVKSGNNNYDTPQGPTAGVLLWIEKHTIDATADEP